MTDVKTLNMPLTLDVHYEYYDQHVNAKMYPFYLLSLILHD